jgi:nitrite reductase (NAD(P)H)
MSSNWQPHIPVQDIKAGLTEGGPDGVMGSENQSHGGPKKKIVVVGLGMVGISFM